MKKKPPIQLSPNRVIALGFLGIILAGALLLMLPMANRSGRGLSFLDSLFTAASATCVTGLVVADTWTQFSLLGQIILLALIQVGGLGYMTMVLQAALLLGRKVGLRQRSVMMESVSAEHLGDVAALLRYILAGTAAIEGAGAALLALRFVPELGLLRGIWYAVFHSVSAFCNAGFDLMGEGAPFSSLTGYAAHPLVNPVIMGLIITGGIGFATWDDIRTNRLKLRRYRMQSKVILSTTLLLILLPAACFFCFEFSGLPLGERLWGSLFQSVTARTAGFNTLDLSRMSEAGQGIMALLMLTGGAPGSTAGGMKVTTLAVLFSTALCVIRRREHTQILRPSPVSDMVRASLTHSGVPS